MADKGRENRQFERYPATMKVQVDAFDSNGNKFSDTGLLQNISGGGANFLAGKPENFYIGQKVDLKICLPYAEEFGSTLEGHGMVVWVGEGVNPEDNTECASIGLCMTDLMAFENLIGTLK